MRLREGDPNAVNGPLLAECWVGLLTWGISDGESLVMSTDCDVLALVEVRGSKEQSACVHNIWPILNAEAKLPRLEIPRLEILKLVHWMW